VRQSLIFREFFFTCVCLAGVCGPACARPLSKNCRAGEYFGVVGTGEYLADAELLGAGEYFAGRVGPEENLAGGVGPADENLAEDVVPAENLADGGVGPAENLAVGRGERAAELLLTGFLIGWRGK
jgi:hypothetical protein